MPFWAGARSRGETHRARRRGARVTSAGLARTSIVNARSWVLVVAAVASDAHACRSPGSSPVPEARADEAVRPASGAVAVVELFTSEGCSSCPPADAVLAELARDGARPVYALAFHVDYWDELGWPDRFASAGNTARQRVYARAFAARGLYTPQMVVGGTEEFTGSDRGHAQEAVARALAHPAAVRLSLQPRRSAGDGVTVDYSAPGAPADSLLSVAIVEHSASTSVRAGENAGRMLHHANVVRAFVSGPLTAATGSTVVRVPTSLRREDAEVMAYVQRPSGAGGGMPVLGAARAPLP